MTAPARVPKVGDEVVYRDNESVDLASYLDFVPIEWTPQPGSADVAGLRSLRLHRSVPYDPSGTTPHSWRWP
jgi:hypothetical protein